MELKINVDESKFKDVLEKELGAFTKEEIHEILKEGMKEYLQNDEILRNVFIDKNYNWNRTSFSYEPKPLLQEMVSKVDISPIFEEAQQKVLDYVSSDEVVSGMAKALLGELLERGVTKYFINNEDFMSQLSYKLRMMMGGN